MFDLSLTAIILIVLAFGGGAAFYRYTLKRDPEKLERWAREIKAAGLLAESKLRDRS